MEVIIFTENIGETKESKTVKFSKRLINIDTTQFKNHFKDTSPHTNWNVFSILTYKMLLLGNNVPVYTIFKVCWKYSGLWVTTHLMLNAILIQVYFFMKQECHNRTHSPLRWFAFIRLGTRFIRDYVFTSDPPEFQNFGLHQL